MGSFLLSLGPSIISPASIETSAFDFLTLGDDMHLAESGMLIIALLLRHVSSVQHKRLPQPGNHITVT